MANYSQTPHENGAAWGNYLHKLYTLEDTAQPILGGLVPPNILLYRTLLLVYLTPEQGPMAHPYQLHSPIVYKHHTMSHPDVHFYE